MIFARDGDACSERAVERRRAESASASSSASILFSGMIGTAMRARAEPRAEARAKVIRDAAWVAPKLRQCMKFFNFIGLSARLRN